MAACATVTRPPPLLREQRRLRIRRRRRLRRDVPGAAAVTVRAHSHDRVHVEPKWTGRARRSATCGAPATVRSPALRTPMAVAGEHSRANSLPLRRRPDFVLPLLAPTGAVLPAAPGTPCRRRRPQAVSRAALHEGAHDADPAFPARVPRSPQFFSRKPGAGQPGARLKKRPPTPPGYAMSRGGESSSGSCRWLPCARGASIVPWHERQSTTTSSRVAARWLPPPGCSAGATGPGRRLHRVNSRGPRPRPAQSARRESFAVRAAARHERPQPLPVFPV
jgi:hypothetical protein